MYEFFLMNNFKDQIIELVHYADCILEKFLLCICGEIDGD